VNVAERVFHAGEDAHQVVRVVGDGALGIRGTDGAAQGVVAVAGGLQGLAVGQHFAPRVADGTLVGAVGIADLA
jgi:hypothetical protein